MHPLCMYQHGPYFHPLHPCTHATRKCTRTTPRCTCTMGPYAETMHPPHSYVAPTIYHMYHCLYSTNTRPWHFHTALVHYIITCKPTRLAMPSNRCSRPHRHVPNGNGLENCSMRRRTPRNWVSLDNVPQELLLGIGSLRLLAHIFLPAPYATSIANLMTLHCLSASYFDVREGPRALGPQASNRIWYPNSHRTLVSPALQIRRGSINWSSSWSLVTGPS